MIVDSNKFLIDSNALITPFNKYYPFDFAPGFWEQMEDHIQKGNIKILDLVKFEVLKGGDELTKWLEKIDSSLIINRQNIFILDNYRRIINYINKCGYYKQSAIDEWMRGDIADPWLIATAMTYGYTIITFETGNNNFSNKHQFSKIKIPDLCNHYNISYQDLFYMMRQLSFRLG